jgi:hypothetical protein
MMSGRRTTKRCKENKKIDIEELQEFNNYIRQWALKKMRKQEKKLLYYAEVYFGEPVTIVYAKDERTSRAGTENII